MPETFLLFRFFFEHIGYTAKWREAMAALSEDERAEALEIVYKNNFTNIDELTHNEKIRYALSFYKNYRGDIANHNSELYKMKQEYEAQIKSKKD